MPTESERRRAVLAAVQAIKEEIALFDVVSTSAFEKAALLQKLAAFAAREDVRGDPVLVAMTEAFEMLVRGRQ